MTIIELKKEDDMFHFTCKGHAKNKLVCASISSVTYGLMAYAEQFYNDFIIDCYFINGDSSLIMKYNEEFIKHSAKLIFVTFKNLEEHFPNDIKLIESYFYE